MKSTEMDISAMGTIFFLFIFAASFLVQNCTPMHHSEDDNDDKGPTLLELTNLQGKHKRFYASVIKLLLKECRNVKDNFSNGDGKLVCGTVEKVNGFLRKMNHKFKLVKDGKEKGNMKELDAISQEIYNSISDDRYTLADILHITHGKSSVNTNIATNGEELLYNKTFAQTFDQLIGELEKEVNKTSVNHNETRAADEIRQIVMRLLEIGAKMEEILDNCVEDNLDWALQQFGANLAIHSIFFDPLKSTSEQRALQTIAKKWMRMLKEGPLEHVGKMEKKFYVHIVVPMVDKCKLWNLGFETITDTLLNGGDAKLCVTVNLLNGYLINMDKQYKLAKKNKMQKMSGLDEISKISKEIFDRIRDDNILNMYDCIFSLKSEHLYDKCYEEVNQVEKSRANSYKAFEEQFEKMIGELKKKQNMPNMDTGEGIQIAYKLHWFGEDMCDLLEKKVKTNKKLEWAFELFVANLAVYSFRLYHPTEAGAKGGIQRIVEKWWQSGQHQQIMANQLASIHESETANSSGSGSAAEVQNIENLQGKNEEFVKPMEKHAIYKQLQ